MKIWAYDFRCASYFQLLTRTLESFRYDVTTALIMESADAMVASGLKDAGYEYVLIDDGWPACDQFAESGHCQTPAPRAADGQIQINSTSFPNGFNDLTAYVHGLGLKIGIYTAVSNVTCGGFMASLYHEAVDAASFGSCVVLVNTMIMDFAAAWGFDFVKFDTCNEDCDVHCIMNSTAHMRDGLNATGRPMAFYIDAGNPT